MAELLVKPEELEAEANSYTKAAEALETVEYVEQAGLKTSLSSVTKFGVCEKNMDALVKCFAELSKEDAKNLLFIRADFLKLDHNAKTLFGTIFE